MANPPSLCRIFCLYTTWIQIASAISETSAVKEASLPLIRGIDIIPSGPRSIHILPSAPSSFIIQSQPSPTTQAPSLPSSLSLIPSISTTQVTEVSVSVSVPYTGFHPYVNTSTAATVASSFFGNASATPVMVSTDQGLKPIPPAATTVGDPNGHPEIPEPNFTATRACRGCDPLVAVSAIGWQDNSGPSSAAGPAVATITAGSSSVVVSQAPDGGNFVIGGSTTLTPGQTITIGDKPVIVQTSAGRPEVVVGSSTVALEPAAVPQITDAPIALPPLLTIGTRVITPDPQTEYIVADQTLSPGGPPITVSGTTISLAPSATALIINGRISSIIPPLGNIYTTEMPAAFSFHNDVYTVNRAGFIILGPGTTLIPGGSPVTVDGTTLSFDQSGTEVVVQGTSSMLQPVTTVVTLTKSIGGGGVAGGGTSGHDLARPTASPMSGGSVAAGPCFGSNDWMGGILLVLLWWSSGILAFSL